MSSYVDTISMRCFRNTQVQCPADVQERESWARGRDFRVRASKTVAKGMRTNEITLKECTE